MKLNQITLPVSDMQAAVAFYLSLGFLQIVDTPHYARFEDQDGTASFSLSLEENAVNGAIIYFEEEELDDWVHRLKEKGHIFLTEPETKSYLWREAMLEDPSGNKIKLYWAGENRLNPPWRVEIRE
ncbi:VOC family protein [Temperatibacter marinus]|uniref:VOC family protein n=1 Tax=Temperatibacter marinus TaxID=1456591 RepID=A0AA52H9A2_9PROT|nr:VOC family protein [Temperatibacter marinus]WND02694.1 VOC family protein [Temperatibacter marinus]